MEYIYLLKNKITNRIYVGKSHNPEWRFKIHMSNLRGSRHSNELMQEDYNLYGEGSFKCEIVESSKSYTRTCTEGKWMLKLKTYDKRYGYNYKDPFFVHRTGKLTKNHPDYSKNG